MYGVPNLSEHDRWRLRNGEMDPLGLVRATMRAVDDETVRDFRYTIHQHNGEAFTLSFIDPQRNQVQEVQQVLERLFGLEAHRDGRTLTVDADPLADCIDTLAGAEVAD